MADRGSSSLPDLDDFINDSRHGPCRVCTEVPEEARTKIQEKYDRGIKAWTAFARYVEACGVTGVSRSMLEGHFNKRGGRCGNA